MLLRLRADDPSARCCLGNKYGAEPRDAAALLQAARALGVNVIGIRHVTPWTLHCILVCHVFPFTNTDLVRKLPFTWHFKEVDEQGA